VNGRDSGGRGGGGLKYLGFPFMSYALRI